MLGVRILAKTHFERPLKWGCRFLLPMILFASCSSGVPVTVTRQDLNPPSSQILSADYALDLLKNKPESADRIQTLDRIRIESSDKFDWVLFWARANKSLDAKALPSEVWDPLVRLSNLRCTPGNVTAFYGFLVEAKRDFSILNSSEACNLPLSPKTANQLIQTRSGSLEADHNSLTTPQSPILDKIRKDIDAGTFDVDVWLDELAADPSFKLGISELPRFIAPLIEHLCGGAEFAKFLHYLETSGSGFSSLDQRNGQNATCQAVLSARALVHLLSAITRHPGLSSTEKQERIEISLSYFSTHFEPTMDWSDFWTNTAPRIFPMLGSLNAPGNSPDAPESRANLNLFVGLHQKAPCTEESEKSFLDFSKSTSETSLLPLDFYFSKATCHNIIFQGTELGRLLLRAKDTSKSILSFALHNPSKVQNLPDLYSTLSEAHLPVNWYSDEIRTLLIALSQDLLSGATPRGLALWETFIFSRLHESSTQNRPEVEITGWLNNLLDQKLRKAYPISAELVSSLLSDSALSLGSKAELIKALASLPQPEEFKWDQFWGAPSLKTHFLSLQENSRNAVLNLGLLSCKPFHQEAFKQFLSSIGNGSKTGIKQTVALIQGCQDQAWDNARILSTLHTLTTPDARSAFLTYFQADSNRPKLASLDWIQLSNQLIKPALFSNKELAGWFNDQVNSGSPTLGTFLLEAGFSSGDEDQLRSFFNFVNLRLLPLTAKTSASTFSDIARLAFKGSARHQFLFSEIQPFLDHPQLSREILLSIIQRIGRPQNLARDFDWEKFWLFLNTASRTMPELLGDKSVKVAIRALVGLSCQAITKETTDEALALQAYLRISQDHEALAPWAWTDGDAHCNFAIAADLAKALIKDLAEPLAQGPAPLENVRLLARFAFRQCEARANQDCPEVVNALDSPTWDSILARLNKASSNPEVLGEYRNLSRTLLGGSMI